MVYRRNLVEQMKIKYGFYENLDFEQTQLVVDEFLQLYQRALEISSAATLTETERQYGDDFIVLSSHFYIELYLRTSKLLIWFFLFFFSYFVLDDHSHLVRALSICVWGLEKSKFNFHIKIIAIRLYCLLGALKPAFDLFQSLDIKHIQMDTFSHIILHDALALYIPDCSESISFAMERFYTSSLREVYFLLFT